MNSANASLTGAPPPEPVQKYNWRNLLFVALSPLVAIAGLLLYLPKYGVQRGDLYNFLLMYVFTGLSISAGYHRCFAHHSYRCHTLVKLFYLLFGAAAFQNSVIRWSAYHRRHHRFTDEQEDPHNIREGFFWVYWGWVVHHDQPSRNQFTVRDLEKDKLIMWQHQYYLPIALLMGLVLPALLGAVLSNALGGLLWGGVLRTVISQHATFLINSASHCFGTQPYSKKDSSRDCWWLMFVSFGDSKHNFHHTFAGDYRNGLKWYEWDPSKWFIRGLSMLALTSHLHRTPADRIARARKRIEEGR